MPAPKDTDNRERDAQIYHLRLKGYSPEEIAPLYGLSPATVADIVSKVSSALHRADPHQHKMMELDRLDRLLKKAIKVLDKKHVAVSHGRVIFDPTTNAPLVDDGPTLDAIKTVLSIMERRARLLGLDAPSTLTINTPPDPLSVELQEMINEAKARTLNNATPDYANITHYDDEEEE